MKQQFLQYKSRGPYGEYESGHGGVISTLQDLLGKVKKERDAGLAAEEKNKKEFQEFDAGLTEALDNGKKSMADIKSAVAQSQEKSSKMEASLLEAQEIYKAEVAHLETIESEFRRKTQNYKVRLGKRSDEAIAVHEAQRILGADVAKEYIKVQGIGAAGKGPAVVRVAQGKWKVQAKKDSFLDIMHKKAAVRRKALKVIRSATTPGLALLALRTTVHFRSWSRGGEDPFAKVKNMIRAMLKKLNDKQAEETRHAAWCDHEMGKTSQNQKRKGEDVQKVTDRLEALSAELTEIKDDIVTTTKDLKEVTGALAAALTIRQREHATNVAAIKQYKGASQLLKRALKVLANYYENKAGGGSEVDKKEFKERHGMATGIIGILEIAQDDFTKLHRETVEAEDAAAKDFKELNGESLVRQAVFQKDLEWKSRTKVKLEFDQTTMNNDLKSDQKELVAIDAYMDKLKASCVVQPVSYEDRKSKREAELASLKEALSALNAQR